MGIFVNEFSCAVILPLRGFNSWGTRNAPTRSTYSEYVYFPFEPSPDSYYGIYTSTYIEWLHAMFRSEELLYVFGIYKKKNKTHTHYGVMSILFVYECDMYVASGDHIMCTPVFAVAVLHAFCDLFSQFWYLENSILQFECMSEIHFISSQI